MGDDDERQSRAVQVVEEPEHLERRRAVEVAGRLVGEHDERLVDERAGDRDSLALATGERRGKVTASVGEPDLVEQLEGARAGLARRAPGEKRGQLDVLPRSELVHEVERLEDEADLPPAQVGKAPLAQGGRCACRRATARRPTGGRGRRAGGGGSTSRNRSVP